MAPRPSEDGRGVRSDRSLIRAVGITAQGGLGLLSRGELARAALDAAGDIQRGLAGLEAGEREQAEGWFRAAADATSLTLADALGWFGHGLGSGPPVLGDWLA